jgi:hypothetical protein
VLIVRAAKKLLDRIGPPGRAVALLRTTSELTLRAPVMQIAA